METWIVLGGGGQVQFGSPNLDKVLKLFVNLSIFWKNSS